LRVWHHNHASIAACIRHERNADANISGRAFDDDTARPELAASLSIVDHGEGRAILDRPTGIEKFGLTVDLAACGLRRHSQPDQWRIADGVQKSRSDTVHRLPTFAFPQL
jgi:hypothetical protein